MDPITRRNFLGRAAAGAAALPWLWSGSSRAAEGATRGRPNIIVMMVDDMGYSDLGCYGGEAKTPNLDALAAGGVRFTNFHNTSRCCPSRACILTGLYPHQTGLGYFVGNRPGGRPAYRGAMVHPCVTMAEALKPAGYATLLSGKWHVGSPEAKGRGFDRQDAYFAGGARSYFDNGKPGWYITEWFADAVVKYVDEFGRKKEPFFLYWTPTAPHFPLHALTRDIKKYEGAYGVGAKAVAEARYKRMVELGIADAKWPWSAPPILSDEKLLSFRGSVRTELDGAGRGQDGNSRKARSFEEMMEIFAAQVDCMDQGVGKVVAKLKEVGAYENTLWLFCSDNGASDESRGAGPIWAWTSNTPFWKAKKSAYEGGIGTPLIAHWPARIEGKQRGSINRTFGHLVDVMPTVLDAAGATRPAQDAQGRDVPAMEGRSLLPCLAGETVALAKPIFIEHRHNRAVITETHKVTADRGEPWRLYDMRSDRFERNDLADKQPDTVKALAGEWDRWAERVGAKDAEGWGLPSGRR